ncbi:MAG: hypothetical protein HDS15_00170 [Bacteroides sp.]|nr:hypothetical protein [Bacteroides sp.]
MNEREIANGVYEPPRRTKDLVAAQIEQLISSDKKCNQISSYDNSYHNEFYQKIKMSIVNYVIAFKNLMWFGGKDLSDPITAFLFYHMIGEQDHYCQSRSKGESIEQSYKRLDQCLDLFMSESRKIPSDWCKFSQKHPWDSVLYDYQGASLIYLQTTSDIEWMKSLQLQETSFVILLTEFDVPESIEFPDNYIAIQREWTDIAFDSNLFIQKNFPLIYLYANTFAWLLHIIKPVRVLSIGNDTIAEKILELLAESLI